MIDYKYMTGETEYENEDDWTKAEWEKWNKSKSSVVIEELDNNENQSSIS